MTQANFTLWTNAALSDEDAANLVFFTHFVIHFLWSSDIFLSAWMFFSITILNNYLFDNHQFIYSFIQSSLHPLISPLTHPSSHTTVFHLPQRRVLFAGADVVRLKGFAAAALKAKAADPSAVLRGIMRRVGTPDGVDTALMTTLCWPSLLFILHFHSSFPSFFKSSCSSHYVLMYKYTHSPRQPRIVGGRSECG